MQRKIGRPKIAHKNPNLLWTAPWEHSKKGSDLWVIFMGRILKQLLDSIDSSMESKELPLNFSEFFHKPGQLNVDDLWDPQFSMISVEFSIHGHTSHGCQGEWAYYLSFWQCECEPISYPQQVWWLCRTVWEVDTFGIPDVLDSLL